jgi:hypothetical protein
MKLYSGLWGHSGIGCFSVGLCALVKKAGGEGRIVREVKHIGILFKYLRNV